VTAFTGFDDHRAWTGLDTRIWLGVLCIAVLTSWAAVQHYLIDRASRAASAMTRAAISRPLYRDRTGPQPALQTGPRPVLASLDGRARPRHARPASSR
jgi:hypothetical protein